MAQELYELPEGWKWRALLDVVSTSGFKVGKIAKKDFQSEGSLPIIDQSQNYIAGYCESKAGFEGELPVVVYGDHTNSVKHIDFQFVCGADGTKVLAPNVGVFSWFLYYALLQFRPESQGYRRHFPILKQQKLPLPPLNEQKRIVAKLDALFTRIDTAITHLQQTLELSKALFASALKSEVSGDGHDWPCRSLNSLGDFSGGGTPSKSKPEYWNGAIPWITPKDMKSWEVSDSLLKVTPKGVTNSSAKMLPSNSVLIVARSGILRHTLPVCINRVEATVNQDIKVFIPGNDVTPEYMQYLLKGHESFILNQLVKGGVTVESLKYKEFQDHVFPIPPTSEQKHIVAHLDALSERTRTLENTTQEKINDLAALKASLLDAAFKGQL